MEIIVFGFVWDKVGFFEFENSCIFVIENSIYIDVLK